MVEEVPFYRAGEVADLLGVDVKTVYVWVRSGSIAHIRTPTGGVRIRGEEVRAMLAGGSVLGQTGWEAQADDLRLSKAGTIPLPPEGPGRVSAGQGTPEES